MTNERLVLNSHDGVPTLFIEDVNDEPVLHWMVAGQVEPFDLWVVVPLSWNDAEEIIRERPELDLFLAKRAGQPARVQLGPRAGWKSVVVATNLPDGPVDELWAANQITAEVAGETGPTPSRTIRALCHA